MTKGFKIFSAALVAAFALMAAACAEEEHEHLLYTEEAVEATCAVEGHTERVLCSICKKVIVPSKTIAKLPHEFNEENVCVHCGISANQHGDFEFTLSPRGDSYWVSGFYAEEPTEAVMPSEYEGLPVTGIAYGAFTGDLNLRSLVVSSSVTSVGAAAFEGCLKLESVMFGANVESIGEGAFSGCKVLKSLFLPEKVTSIGEYAFHRCENLGIVKLGKNVNSIGRFAFYGCKRLKEIQTDENNQAYYSQEGCLYDKINKSLVVYPSGRENTKLEIPEGIESIDEFAVYQCPTITQVVIPDSVTKVSNRSFCGCYRLNRVEIGSGVTIIEEAAFSSCSMLSSVRMRENIQSIADGAFYQCKNLTELTIPQSVTHVGYDSFMGCDKLVKTINGVKYVDSWAIGYEGTITYAALRPQTRGLSERAFYNCDRLTGITFPQGLRSICNNAFYGCTRLMSVEIPEGVTEIGQGAFYGCRWMKNVSLPASLQKIGRQAFYGCSDLERATFADPSGWKVQTGETERPKPLPDEFSKDAGTAAKYLSSSTYGNGIWTHS